MMVVSFIWQEQHWKHPNFLYGRLADRGIGMQHLPSNLKTMLFSLRTAIEGMHGTFKHGTFEHMDKFLVQKTCLNENWNQRASEPYHIFMPAPLMHGTA
jgi:hypothetical protein